MPDINDEEAPITPDIISPDEVESKDSKAASRAKNLKFEALDYGQVDDIAADTEESKPKEPTGNDNGVKALPSPKAGKEEDSSSNLPPDEEAELRGKYIPPVLSWVLGFMSLLLFLVGVGLILANFWDNFPPMVKVCTLVCTPAFLWGVYIVGFKNGSRAQEIAALLAALSWLDALFIYQFCIQPLPLWVLGSILTFGLMIIPLVKPLKMAMCSLAIGALLQYGLMVYDLVTATTYGEWALIWASIMAMTMVWSHIGSWCALTKRKEYNAYAFIGPLAQFVFLLMLIVLLVYSSHLIPAGVSDFTTLNQWLAILGVWVVAMLPILPLQRHFAEVCNHPNISNSFLLYWAISIMTLPLGLLLVRDLHALLLMPLILGYLFSMVYYGADYHVPNFVIMGSVGIFLTVVSIPIHMGTGLIWSAVILFILSIAFFMSMTWLNTRRKMQIARRREEIAALRAAEKERKNTKVYHEKERLAIALPDRDRR